MADQGRGPGWWQTLPGIVTAIATLVTAVGGLLVILAQTGMIGGTGASREPDTTPRVAADARGSGPASSGAPRAGVSSPPHTEDAALKPWAQSDVVVTRRDGRTTIVRADTFSNCLTGIQTLTLAGGQMVAFDLMRAIDVVESNPISATVVITLLDGRTVEDRTAANCDLFGYNTLGRFSVLFTDVKRVEFLRRS